MPRKTKIGTEVAHVTRDSNTTFKVKRSNVKVTGGGAYCGGLPHRLLRSQLFQLVASTVDARCLRKTASTSKEAMEYTLPISFFRPSDVRQ